MFDQLVQDTTYAFRQLRLNPGFTAVAVVTLAIGIGLNTAVLGIADATLLRDPPYLDANAVVRIWQQQPEVSWNHIGVSAPEYFDYRQRTVSFEQIAAFRYLYADLTGAGEPRRIAALRATSNLFPLLRVRAQIGTLYDANADSFGERVAVLSDSFWPPVRCGRQYLGPQNTAG